LKVTSVVGCKPKLNDELALKSNFAIMFDKPLTISGFDEVGVETPN
jgi:hypothetical protein